MKRVSLTLLACVALTLVPTTVSAESYSRRRGNSSVTHLPSSAQIRSYHSRNRYQSHPRSMYNGGSNYRSRSYTNRGPSDYYYSPSPRSRSRSVTREYGYWGGGYETYYER